MFRPRALAWVPWWFRGGGEIMLAPIFSNTLQGQQAEVTPGKSPSLTADPAATQAPTTPASGGCAKDALKNAIQSIIAKRRAASPCPSTASSASTGVQSASQPPPLPEAKRARVEPAAPTPAEPVEPAAPLPAPKPAEPVVPAPPLPAPSTRPTPTQPDRAEEDHAGVEDGPDLLLTLDIPIPDMPSKTEVFRAATVLAQKDGKSLKEFLIGLDMTRKKGVSFLL